MPERVASPAVAVEAPSRLVITTTDLLKVAGVVILLADHVGLYFDPDQPWWRVVGRVAAPIFFFLIGFARTRTVPWTWLGLGVVLTVAEGVTSGKGPGGYFLNILVNFALIRLALGWVEARIMPFPARIAAFALLCILLSRAINAVLEYGSEGWLWALFGLSHRTALEESDAGSRRKRDLIAVAAACTYGAAETFGHGFGPVQGLVLALLIAALASVLMRFRRSEVSWQPGSWLATIVRTCGRRSLDIYAGSLLLMQLSSYALGFR